jgi:hypothetical protein
MTTQPSPKHAYFMVLHTDLALRYFLTLEAISWLRAQAIGKGLSLGEVREGVKRQIADLKRGLKGFKTHKILQNADLKLTAQNTLLYIQAKQNLLAFLATCTPTQWQDITQLTDFDRNAEKLQKGTQNGNRPNDK